MSFRCTNNLIGTIRHCLALEAAHRQLVRRTFTGRCNGIEVTCSAYGTVLSIKEVDTVKSAILYRLIKKEVNNPNSINNNDGNIPTSQQLSESVSQAKSNININDSNTSKSAECENSTNTSAYRKAIDYAKLAESIQAAVWQAVRQIQRSKEQAHFRSLRDNNQLLSEGRLTTWYEHDSTTMHPRPFDALKQELATPWMQAVRFGKRNNEHLLLANDKSKSCVETDSCVKDKTMRSGGVGVLSEEDTKLHNIPIASLHSHYTPTLIHLERSQHAALPTRLHMPDNVNQTQITSTKSNEPSNHNEVDTLAVLREYASETSRDEQLFWDRVELIRRGQLATLPKHGKRAYNDSINKINNSTALAMSAINEKIELRFTN